MTSVSKQKELHSVGGILEHEKIKTITVVQILTPVLLLSYFLFFFLRFYLSIFRERGREGAREGEKHQCVVAFCMPPTGDLA